MGYKLSKYNLTIAEESEDIVIWNTRSGAIVKLDVDLWESITNGNYYSEKFLKFKQGLVDQGIIIDEKLNEYNTIILNKKREQLCESDTFSLIIAPTLGCNFKCNYCFEKSTTDMYLMSNETICDVVLFVKDKISSNSHLKNIDVTWFGGEPLLGFEKAIVPLSKQLIDICEENNIAYKGSIITNGFFLSSSIIKELIEEYKVKRFQITFDGLRKTYCKTKNTTESAYTRVKNNMLSLSKYARLHKKDIRIDIRINVDRNNLQEATQFVEEIRAENENTENLLFYLGRLQGEEGRFLSLEEFEMAEDSFEDCIGENLHDVWEPKCIWCIQHSMSSLCVGPHGELWKCERDIGDKDKMIGDIKTGIYFNQYLYDFLNIENNEMCRDCKLFPVCLGGCPYMAMQNVNRCECISSINYAIKLAKRHIGIL